MVWLSPGWIRTLDLPNSKRTLYHNTMEFNKWVVCSTQDNQKLLALQILFLGTEILNTNNFMIESFNTNISHQIFDCKITFVNLQRKNINSKVILYSKISLQIQHEFLTLNNYWIHPNLNQKYIYQIIFFRYLITIWNILQTHNLLVISYKEWGQIFYFLKYQKKIRIVVNNSSSWILIKQGQKRLLDTPKRMIKKREREGKREGKREKER